MEMDEIRMVLELRPIIGVREAILNILNQREV
jgi:hypothetical protein